MKHTIWIAWVLILAAPFANARSIQQENVIAQVTDVNVKVHAVSVDSTGVLTITLNNSRGPVATQLYNETLTLLAQHIHSLATTPLTTTFNRFVCYTFIAVPGLNLSLQGLTPSGDFYGIQRLILSAEGCQVREHTRPQDDVKAQEARDLRYLLESLASETLAGRD